jgi:hypothetical protein
VPERLGLRRATGWLLIAVMAIGSVFLWLGIPFLWVWGVSQTVDSSQPTLGPYLVVLVGIPTSMVLTARALGRLGALHARVTGTEHRGPVRLPWLKSMRDGRDSGRPRQVLDVVMVVSVSTALLLFGLWFLLFAEGGGLPS